MVYLGKIIENAKGVVVQANNIEYAAYLALRNKSELNQNSFDLSPQEEVALKGFRNESVDEGEVKAIVSKKAIKGVDATSNIYKFSGLYLAAKNALSENLRTKYQNANLRQKYYLSLIESSFRDRLKGELNGGESSADSIILTQILFPDSEVELLENAISEFANDNIGVQEILILEDLEKALLRVKYVNLNAEELVRNIIYQFGNSTQKITTGRRKGHDNFEINDEYDVQDILYVILKSVFPNLRDEDPIPKVGAKSTKIDLILREEKILIEVKMIKKGDSNETHFIEQLKVDFESYHQCQWLEKLFCFVYDPLKKTKDISNFNDLNGKRKKNDHEYDVEVIVIN